MRVLILSNIYPPGFMGGYELGASEVARGLAAAGHQVEVLTSDYLVDDSGADAGGAGAPIIYRGLDCLEPNRSPHESCLPGGFVVARNLRGLAGKLQTMGPDVVLCFNLAGLGAPSILRLLVATGMRPVIFMMDHVFSTMCANARRRRGYELVFSVAEWPEIVRFLFMSQTLRDEVEGALGFALSHTSIVPGWFDPAAEAEVSPRGSPTRFVFASRLAGHKGEHILLDACRLLLDGGHADFTLDIYGAGEVAAIVQRIVALRLSDHVRFCGSPGKAALMPLLSGYDSLVFPTMHREPFGFIVAEAAVAGCIPVMTYGVGAGEWFLDGVDCIKTVREPAALQAAMLRIMTMEPDLRVTMRRRAQATARRFLRFDDVLCRIETALAEAAGNPTYPARAMEAAMAVLTDVWSARPDA
jgi:glycosyltransferase involved in cell wall biosynthesis